MGMRILADKENKSWFQQLKKVYSCIICFPTPWNGFYTWPRVLGNQCGRREAKMWIISSLQWPGLWYILEQGLFMVSTWNPDFNLICGLLYKEKSRGRNFPPFVFPGFPCLLFSWALPSLDTLKTSPFLICYKEKITPTPGCSWGWCSRDKMHFPLLSCSW